MNAVDTNVLIYSVDARSEQKQLRALELLLSLPAAETVIPWQVACEVGAALDRMSRLGTFKGDPSSAIGHLRSCFPIAVPQVSSLWRAQEILGSLGISYWDAMLLAACADAGVTRLYTEDIQSKPIIDGVQIVNPF